MWYEVLTTSSAGGTWTHSTAFRMEMVWKRIEIGDSWVSAKTALAGVERKRPVIALAASNLPFSCLLEVVTDSQGPQAEAANSSVLLMIAMQT